MKQRIRSLAQRACQLFLFLAAFACGPYLISYKHVCIDEFPGLSITKFSESSTTPNGAPLHSPKIGLPLEARIDRPNYQILIHTPMNPEPVLFLNTQTHSGSVISITGPNLIRIHDNYQYSFLVGPAKGSPMSLSIYDSQGKLLGTERVTYHVKSRGFTYGIEAI